MFGVEDGYAPKRSIKTSRRNPADALVEDGLQPDRSVVVHPPVAPRAGAKVESTKAKQG